MSLPFYCLWVSQSLVSVSSALYSIALVTLVYHYTGSATFAASVALARVMAKFVSSIFIPLMMDKYQLRSLLLVSQIGQWILVSAMSLLVNLQDGKAVIPFLYLLIFLDGCLDGCAVPARAALVPRLVEQDKLVQANSLLSTSEQTLSLLGWTFGGMLVVFLGGENVLWITVLLYLLSIVACVFIRYAAENHLQPAKKRVNWSSIKEGWLAIYQNPQLRLVTMMDVIEGIAGGIWIGGITLVFVKEVLHKGEEWWGYINSAYYIGAIIGGVIIMSVSKWVHERLLTGMIIGSFGVCIFVLLYSVTDIPLLSLILVLCMGPFYQLRDIAQRTLIQKSTPAELQAKVFAAQSSLQYAIFGISVLLMGTISDTMGVQKVYLFATILYFLSSMMAVSKRLFSKRTDNIHYDPEY